ncbi:hypothetical protein OVA11_05110 [Caulobacter sp. SL161]|uniref:hypothetical protein n=1 Tax=Caulobacter sp. SL161 TaxID=2995156 RepID=UPI0022743798|nr:hypothetical protein [Caulobacter sp. SL161]MCY1646473.1 hypothetical protein [Caulobacter sp. SL161]
MGKTVFVLGAGASKDFGNNMPIGEELAATIDDMLIKEFADASMHSDGLVKDAFRRGTGLYREHRAAAIQIGKSLHSKSSIDELIDEWSDFPEFSNVAKHAIAAALLTAEFRSNLCHSIHDEVAWASAFRPMRDSWASWLFRNVGGQGVQRRHAFQAFSDVAFVTFNYDRCLEQFLLANFMHTCNLHQDVALAALNNVEIHHAYGRLGPLSSDGTLFTVPYGSTDPYHIHKAATQIKTFTEEVESGAAQRIRNTIFHAGRLIFLGFGFHNRNLDLLFGNNCNCPDIPVFGTSSILETRAWTQPAARFETASRQFWRKMIASEFMRTDGEDVLFG